MSLPRSLLLTLLLTASTSCWRRSTTPAPSCPPSLPPVLIDPPATAVDCRTVLGPMPDLTPIRGLPRCLTAEGQRKPERVRCLAYIRVSGAITIAVEDPKLIPTFGDDILEIRGGYFVPDGAA